jgi:transcription termination factor Rho
MAAARNLRDAGSLTVIASARAPLGGETTIITLLTSGEFPSVDEAASGTLRAELLESAPAKPVRARKPRAPRKKAEPAEASAEPETADGADVDL